MSVIWRELNVHEDAAHNEEINAHGHIQQHGFYGVNLLAEDAAHKAADHEAGQVCGGHALAGGGDMGAGDGGARGIDAKLDWEPVSIPIRFRAAAPPSLSRC